MNIKPIYLAAIAFGAGTATWAIRRAIDLPNVCAPIKLIYDNCYKVALGKLGGGYDLFDFTSWGRGLEHISEAHRICADKDNYNDCMNGGVPYIATAVLCSAIAICAIVKLARR